MNGDSNNLFGSVRRVTTRGLSVPLLTPLLVVALFLCHGAAGGLHQATLEPALPGAVHQSSAQELPAHDPAGGHSGEHPTKHVDYLAYAAAFFAALLGTLLRPSFGGVGRRFTAPLGTPRAAFVTPLLCRGCHPTPPNLQVFRL